MNFLFFITLSETFKTYILLWYWFCSLFIVSLSWFSFFHILKPMQMHHGKPFLLTFCSVFVQGGLMWEMDSKERLRLFWPWQVKDIDQSEENKVKMGFHSLCGMSSHLQVKERVAKLRAVLGFHTEIPNMPLGFTVTELQYLLTHCFSHTSGKWNTKSNNNDILGISVS